MKLRHTEVKFYPELKSQTGLSSLRVSCKRALRAPVLEVNWIASLISTNCGATFVTKWGYYYKSSAVQKATEGNRFWQLAPTLTPELLSDRHLTSRNS